MDVEINAGVLLGTAAVAVPFTGFAEILEQNSELADADQVIVVTARNQGALPVTVTQFKLWFGLGSDVVGILIGSDQFPSMNPRPGTRLDVGGAQPFIFSVDQVRVILRELISGRRVLTDLRGQVMLGTGEEISSDPVGIEHLPFWDDRAAFAKLVEELRVRSIGDASER